MNSVIPRQFSRRLVSSGYATVLTLFFLSIGTTLAAGFYCMLQSSIAIAANEQRAAQALSSAESGLQFMEYQLIKASVKANLNGSSEKWLDTLSVGLMQNLEVTGILATNQVNYNASTFTVTIPMTGTPAFKLKNGCTFTSTIVPNGALTNLILTVTGQGPAAKTRRVLQIGLNALPPIPADLGSFAMVAKGTITLPGNVHAGVFGYDPATNSSNGLVGKVYYPWGIGNGSVVALLAPTAPALVFDNPPPLIIPEVNVGFLEDMKGSKLTQFTAPSGNQTDTLTNRYITANQTFSKNVVINGILYVQAGVSLAFNGNVTLNGTIVYQRTTVAGSSTISFDKSSVVTNSATASASQLSNTGLSTDQLKALAGWSILAPETNLDLANGNGVQKAFGGSLHINNLTQAAGQGGADATLCLNKANIICEGTVDMSGNRVFWILPPGDLAGSGSLGECTNLYAMAGTYLEP